MKNIPRKEIKCRKITHPWLNSRCDAAIETKNNTEGTDVFTAADAKCSTILREEHAKYAECLKSKLAALPRSNKQWWGMNRELLQRRSNIKSIPLLREGNSWLVDAKAKADIFARTFKSKSQLP